MSHALDRIRNAARQRKKEKFTALFHHINPEMLRTAFYALKRSAAPGVDGQTWRTYEAYLDQRIVDLRSRVQRGVYRALEDKIVQRATATVLNQIYEEDFLVDLVQLWVPTRARPA